MLTLIPSEGPGKPNTQLLYAGADRRGELTVAERSLRGRGETPGGALTPFLPR